MNVLVIDTDCVGLSFCWHCSKAGHKVKWFIKDKPSNNKETGEGFPVEKIENWVSSVKWADLIFVTANDDYIKRLEFFRNKGAMVFGPSVESADLEINRAKGMDFLKKHKIDVPEYETFKDLKAAEKHVRSKPERYVFKTMGDNEDKALSYCSKSAADMIARLERWQDLGLNPKGEVMLQTFIEGIELGVSRWMGATGFIGMYNESFEHKKLMPGNCGPNTGEMGTVMAYTKKSKIGDEVLKPLEGALMEMGHFGDTAVNCMVDTKGKAWPLEFTMRPGWPEMNIMLSEHRGDPCKWMLDALRGKDSLQASEKIYVGVVIAQPDFPYSQLTKAETADIPIYGVDEKKTHPQSVKIASMPAMEGDKVAEKEMWATAGDYVAVVVGSAKSVSGARGDAYKAVEDMFIPNMIYRDDIGEKLKDNLPKLHSFGYATAFNY